LQHQLNVGLIQPLDRRRYRLLVVFDNAPKPICPSNAPLHYPSFGYRNKATSCFRAGRFLKIDASSSQWFGDHAIICLVTMHFSKRSSALNRIILIKGTGTGSSAWWAACTSRPTSGLVYQRAVVACGR